MQAICMDGKCLENCLWMVLNGKKYVSIWWRLYKNYNEDSDRGYIVKVDVKYPKHLHDLHRNLPFLPERMKSNKWNKLVCNLDDKKTMLFI